MVGRSERAPVVRRDALVDVENAVDRRFIGARQFRHDHVGKASVAAEDGGRAQSRRPRARRRRVRPRSCCRARCWPAPASRPEARSTTGRASAGGRRSRSDRGLRRDANSRLWCRRTAPGSCRRRRAVRRRRIRADPGRSRCAARLRHADRIIDVDDIGHRSEDFFQLGGDGAAGGRIRPIDLGEKRGQHRRAGRHLHDARDGAGRQGQRLQPRLADRARWRGWCACVLALGARLRCSSPSSGASRI